MTQTPVVAQSPLSFNSGGTHRMIPLSALYFDDEGKLKAERWPLYGANSATVDALLARLLKEGMIRAGTKPAAKPAFTATAVSPGTAVGIEIEIANVVPNVGTPASSTSDFKVTEKEVYTGLESGTMRDRIGAVSGGGKSPGLVFLSSVGAPTLPKAGLYPLAGDPGKVDVPENSGGGTAFSLQSRGTGADAALTSIEIKDVDTVSSKFTLIATWTKSANAIAMTGAAAAFAYAVAITAPTGGFLAPVAGKISLLGGADAVSVAPVKSSVTVPAQ